MLVVADGCRDDTAGVVGQFEPNLQVNYIEQAHSGPAAARNRGAAAARGTLLIFIDDDVEAQPQFVEAHLRAHQSGPGLVSIGYLPPLLQDQSGFFRVELFDWWETMFRKMRAPGHRFRYSDLLSGNFSIAAALFRRVGGFDARFRCHEDYELGVRLQRAGARFAFSLQAAGFHHECSDLQRVLRRKYDEGKADVYLGRIYPDLRPALPMACLQERASLPMRMLQFLAFTRPGTGDDISGLFLGWLGFFDRARFYYLWRRLLDGLLGYWYWRGVSEELGSSGELQKFLHAGACESCPPSILEINLADGISKAEQLVDIHRPDSLKLRLNEQWIGNIPVLPGGEKLSGAHLRPLLATKFALPLLKALALDGALGVAEITPELIARWDEGMIRMKRHEKNETGSF